MLTAAAVTGAASQDGLIAPNVPETRRLPNLLDLTKTPDIQLSLRWILAAPASSHRHGQPSQTTTPTRTQ